MSACFILVEYSAICLLYSVGFRFGFYFQAVDEATSEHMSSSSSCVLGLTEAPKEATVCGKTCRNWNGRCVGVARLARSTVMSRVSTQVALHVGGGRWDLGVGDGSVSSG